MTSMVSVLYVDGGMWRDPAIYGPFPSNEAAIEWLTREYPDMQPQEGVATSFEAGDDEAILIPLADVAEERYERETVLRAIDGMIESTEEFIGDDGLRADDQRIHDLSACIRARDLYDEIFAPKEESE